VQPTNQTVDENSVVMFSIVATGVTDYVVYHNSDSVGDGDSYTFTPTLDNDGDSVWWKLSNAEGDVYSDTVFLTVNDTIMGALSFTTNPRDTTVLAGQRVWFKAAASGCENIQYQAVVNGSDYGVGDSVSFIPDTSHDNSLIYFKAWSGECDTVWSDTALLRVYSCKIDTPFIDENGFLFKGYFNPASGWTCTQNGESATINTLTSTEMSVSPASRISLRNTVNTFVFTNGSINKQYQISFKRTSLSSSGTSTGVHTSPF
jgi:hypothetical protein